MQHGGHDGGRNGRRCGRMRQRSCTSTYMFGLIPGPIRSGSTWEGCRGLRFLLCRSPCCLVAVSVMVTFSFLS